jgi:hypothetical protein
MQHLGVVFGKPVEERRRETLQFTSDKDKTSGDNEKGTERTIRQGKTYIRKKCSLLS